MRCVNDDGCLYHINYIVTDNIILGLVPILFFPPIGHGSVLLVVVRLLVLVACCTIFQRLKEEKLRKKPIIEQQPV